MCDRCGGVIGAGAACCDECAVKWCCCAQDLAFGWGYWPCERRLHALCPRCNLRYLMRKDRDGACNVCHVYAAPEASPESLPPPPPVARKAERRGGRRAVGPIGGAAPRPTSEQTIAWVEMLKTIYAVGDTSAEVIASVYPSAGALLDAYRRAVALANPADRESVLDDMLAEIIMPSGKLIGIEVSRRVRRAFLAPNDV